MKNFISRVALQRWMFVGIFLAELAPGWCQEPAMSPDYFPLQKGNYWMYSAHIDWTVSDGGGEVRQGDVSWKSEVVDVFAKGNVFAARLHGFVYDLSWYEPGKEPGDYIIVLVGINHYYLIGEDADAFWQKLADSDGESLLEELADDNLFLEVPLLKGAIFGEPSQTPRGRYCSVVEDEQPFDLSSIVGAPGLNGATEFSVAFRTCPDHSILGFTPGIGVTRYEYQHHGTTANCKARLVEFHCQ